MIADLKPYSEYKESGLPWFGKIPDHWKTGPGFAAFREKYVKNTGMAEKQVLSLSYGKIIIKPPEKLHGLVPDSFETYQIVDSGDIIIRSTDLQNDWTSLRVGLVRDRGIITSAYLCFSTTGTLLPEYGYQLLHSFDLMKVFYGMGSGLRQNLSFLDFKRMIIFVPPPDEQAAIVRFLDHTNRQIERFIKAKKKVIALMNEQKQAIIHRAVTRGLDPDVSLKPAGIPWLGDIPKHWELKRLKSIAQIRYGLGQPPRETETGLPLIRATNVDSGSIVTKNLIRVDPNDVPKARNAFLTEGEIIVVRSGAYTADSAIIPKEYEGSVAGYDMVVTIRKARPTFVAQALLSSYVRVDQLIIASMRAAQPHLNAEELGSAVILLPPDDEQERIVKAVKEQSAPLQTAISCTEREIALLREYRTRLIADVVTGKLDVREAAKKLPDEAAESGIINDDEISVGDEEMEESPEMEREET